MCIPEHLYTIGYTCICLQREIPEIRKIQLEIQREVKEIKRVVKTVKDMHVQNKRMESMLRALMKQQDTISWHEEDYSTDEERTVTHGTGKM